MKDLINVLELIIIVNALWRFWRFIRGKKYKKTLIGKVWLLCSRQLHGSLDKRLREQSKRLAESRQAYDNVIALHTRKRIK